MKTIQSLNFSDRLNFRLEKIDKVVWPISHSKSSDARFLMIATWCTLLDARHYSPNAERPFCPVNLPQVSTSVKNRKSKTAKSRKDSLNVLVRFSKRST